MPLQLSVLVAAAEERKVAKSRTGRSGTAKPDHHSRLSVFFGEALWVGLRQY